MVMHFDLSIATSTLMRVMNQVLRSSIGSFLFLYYDDILIYYENETEHKEHLREVSLILRYSWLIIILKKHHFAMTSFLFCSLIFGVHGIVVIDCKPKRLQGWPTPKKVSEVPRVIGLAMFYQ